MFSGFSYACFVFRRFLILLNSRMKPSMLFFSFFLVYHQPVCHRRVYRELFLLCAGSSIVFIGIRLPNGHFNAARLVRVDFLIASVSFVDGGILFCFKISGVDALFWNLKTILHLMRLTSLILLFLRVLCRLTGVPLSKISFFLCAFSVVVFRLYSSLFVSHCKSCFGLALLFSLLVFSACQLHPRLKLDNVVRSDVQCLKM